MEKIFQDIAQMETSTCFQSKHINNRLACMEKKKWSVSSQRKPSYDKNRTYFHVEESRSQYS